MKAEYQEPSKEVDKVARIIVDAAFHVHKNLGPGLLESVYETCLVHEIKKRGMPMEQQKQVQINYDGIKLDAGLRVDLLVNDAVVVELKAIEKILPVHEAQLLTYLKLMDKRVGLLINFNVPLIKNGIKRKVI